ncbi:MAG TPA: hypothetical protein PLI68_10490 [Bacteroidia bacterium]|nr:hypothetical protein [Bacteroidia bacterium]HRH09461.1 hypothetical protein [Bacteroidia bacterium]HRH63743.1 hypothetical protein [Bacteroidia bacterium]
MKHQVKSVLSLLKSGNQNAASNRWVTFLYCLLIAFLFWLLIVFSNEYKAPVSFNLRYINFPQDKMLANKLPGRVDIEITTSGFTFLGFYFNRLNDTLYLDVSKLRKNKNEQDYYLPGYSQAQQFEAQLGNQLKISKIDLDTLHFYFDKKITKVVPVRLNLNYEFEKQFQLSGKIELKPSKIVLSGPASVMNNLVELNTQQLNFKGLNKTILRAADIIIPAELNSIDFSTKKVVVKIPVEKFTEGTLELPVEVLNVPEQYQLKTFPSRVKITYLVGLSNYQKVSADQFSLLAYYDAKDEEASSLKLKLVKFPEIVRQVKIETENVEFILKKK